ncbi:conjugal transfer protein TrbF [Sphingomonas sp. FW199]|uniref:conjugal transfer protein TrbF n=1 Tax=Sphingomonas sp. FW199 TaxID=3400217 RepID=UPI003CF5A245
MFRRASIRYARTPEPLTPYHRARQVWDDRIGAARVQAHHWRLACFGQLCLSAGLAAALAWHSAQGSVVPWIVEIDRLGEARAMGPAEARPTPSDPQIAFHLARFIEQVRSLPADPVILRQNWLRAYDLTSERGAAVLSDHARRSDPFVNLGRAQVAVDVSSVIRASPTSFRIAWTERRYVDGGLAETSRWSAIVTLSIVPPRTADMLQRNPLGIRIDALNWSKELGQ